VSLFNDRRGFLTPPDCGTGTGIQRGMGRHKGK
jgi:hypothetical protein